MGAKLPCPPVAFEWKTDGENAGEPKWVMQYGDYTARVTRGFGDGFWSATVNSGGNLGFQTAAEGKAHAEKLLTDHLVRRVAAATHTLALFDPAQAEAPSDV